MKATVAEVDAQTRAIGQATRPSPGVLNVCTWT